MPARWDLTWPLTRWERRTIGLLTAEGLDGYSAAALVLDRRCRRDESPWQYLLDGPAEVVRREWLESLGAERGGQRVCGDVLGIFGEPAPATGWE